MVNIKMIWAFEVIDHSTPNLGVHPYFSRVSKFVFACLLIQTYLKWH